MKKTIALLACLFTGSMLRAQAVPMALEDWRTTQGTLPKRMLQSIF